jgi:Predicted acetyltransferase
MEEVKLQISEKGKGEFYIQEEEDKIGEMIIGISGSDLTVYHTEVIPGYEGKGLAQKMLDAMVAYARNKNLKVIPLCPFVHSWFAAHPGEYQDVWKNKKN